MKSAFRVDIIGANGTTVEVSDVSLAMRASQPNEIAFSVPADVAGVQGFGYGKFYRIYHAVYGQLGAFAHLKHDSDADGRKMRITATSEAGSWDAFIKGYSPLNAATITQALDAVVTGTNIGYTLDNATGDFAAVTLRVEGMSILGMLNAIKTAERGYWADTSTYQSPAFRFGRFNAARLAAATPDATLANAAMVQRRGVSDLTILTHLSYATDASRIVNVIAPVGGGDGSARVDLRYSTRNSPYTIQTFGSIYTLEDTASIATYGRHEKFVRIDDVRPTTDSTERINRANTLYDLAALQLSVAKDAVTEYRIECVDPPAAVRPGSVIVVDFRGVVEDASGRRSFLRIDNQRFFVLEIERKYDADGVVASLVVSANGERIPDESDALIQALRATDTSQRNQSATLTQTETTTALGGPWVPTSRTLLGGIGINTIGDLSADRSISVNLGAGLDNYAGAIGLGAPGALSVGTTNSVFGTSHTHAITSSSNPGAAASLLATDASGYLTLVRQTLTDRLISPLIASISDLTLNAGSGLVKLAASNSFQSSNFASQTTGFRVTQAGEGDFRYLYTDELRAKTFTVDLTAALAGSERITKSFGVVYQDFTLPAAGSSTTFLVRDHPSATGIRVFENRDLVQFRVFTRTAGDLTIADAWGDVMLDTTYGTAGFLTLADGTPTQRYTFTRRTGLTIDDQNDDPITDQTGDPILANNVTTPEGNAGAVAVLRDSIVLDYGKSQGGWHETTTVDGSTASWFNNSPYSHVVTWTLHPKNATVRARFGNLRGITGVSNEYGLFAGSGTSNADQFIRVGTSGVLLNNVPLALYSAGSQRVNIDAAGNNVWFSNDGGVTKALSWNGSTLSIVGAITVTGGNALTSGSAAADVNANATFINGGKVSAASLDVITANMGLLTAGEILLGNQTTFSGTFTGLRMRKAGSTYELAGYNAGVVQAYFGSDGKLYAGTTSDSVVLASNGVSLLATPVSYPSNMGTMTWKKYNSSTGLFDDVASIGGWYLNSTTSYFQINATSGIAIGRLRGTSFNYVNVDSLIASGWFGGSGFVRADGYFQSGYGGPTWVLGDYAAAGVGGYTGYITITINGTARKVPVYA